MNSLLLVVKNELMVMVLGGRAKCQIRRRISGGREVKV